MGAVETVRRQDGDDVIPTEILDPKDLSHHSTWSKAGRIIAFDLRSAKEGGVLLHPPSIIYIGALYDRRNASPYKALVDES
jgi:hypothetical protein